MARLFGADYHNLSQYWFFKSVNTLSRNRLVYNVFQTEDGNTLFVFLPNSEFSKLKPFEVSIYYNPKSKKILKNSCTLCEEDSCKHYFSAIKYAYAYLKEDSFDKAPQVVYQKHLHISNEYYTQIAQNARVWISGLYDKSDKIRICLDEFLDFPIYRLCFSLATGEIETEDSEFLELLDEADIQLFTFLQKNKCSFGKKGISFTLYKQVCPTLFTVLKSLNRKIFIKETQKQLLPTKDFFRLVFHITRKSTDSYQIFVEFEQPEHRVFFGQSIFILAANRLYTVNLPFKDKKRLLKNELVFSEHDFVVYLAFSKDSLEKQGFHTVLHTHPPRIYQKKPKVKFTIQKSDKQVLMEGFINFEGLKQFPLSVLESKSQLIKNPKNGMWFCVPFQTKQKIENFLGALGKNYSQKLLFDPTNIEILSRKIYLLSEPDWTFLVQDSLKKFFVRKVEFKASIMAKEDSKINWFEYSTNYTDGDITISHIQFKDFLDSKEEFLVLPDGRRVKPTQKSIDTFSKIENMDKHSVKTSQNWRKLPLAFYLQLSQLFKDKDNHFLETMLDAIVKRRLPQRTDASLTNLLRPYQKDGVLWLKMLSHYGLSGILADDMGIGKTVQAISILAGLSKNSLSLVVCPKTLLFNWEREINKFYPHLPYYVYDKVGAFSMKDIKKPAVIIVSYSTLCIDIGFFREFEFDYAILDEAQYIKNRKSRRSIAVKKLKAKNKLCLTGTPIENSLDDIFSQFEFLIPHYLPLAFRQQKDLEESEKNQYLKKLVTPFILRRTKSQVLDQLPRKTEQLISVPLSKKQREFYELELHRIKNQLHWQIDHKQKPNAINILASITKLRQIANHPALIDPTLADVESGKLNVLLEIVEKAQRSGRKIIIFSQFVKMLKIIEKELSKLKSDYLYMDGTTKNRKQLIDRFNNDSRIRLFLASLKVGGVGINLTSADTVILTDPWWNPAVENQAIGRIHRLGQQKKSIIYRLISQDSIEQKIKDLQKKKRVLYDTIFKNDSTYLESLTLDDLKTLFNL